MSYDNDGWHIFFIRPPCLMNRAERKIERIVMEPENLPPECVQPDADKRRGLIERHRAVAVVLSLLALLGAGPLNHRSQRLSPCPWANWATTSKKSPTLALGLNVSHERRRIALIFLLSSVQIGRRVSRITTQAPGQFLNRSFKRMVMR